MEGDVDRRETDGGKHRPYVLHRGMLDAALQACIGLLREPVEHQKTQERLLQTSVPFALEELLIVSEMPAQGWAWVRLRSHSTWMGTGPVPPSVFDIEVCDDAGHIALHLHGLSIRPLPTEKEASTLLLTPGWKEEAVGRQSLAEETPSSAVGTGPCVCSLTPVAAPLVLLCDLPGIEASRLQAQLIEGGRCLSLRSIQFRRDHRFRDAVVQLIQELQHLQQSRSADGGKGLAPFLVQVVVAHREEPSFLEALVGVLKVAQQEYPKLRGQLIEVDGEPEEEELLTWLRENQLQMPRDPYIRYRDGKRWVREWQEVGGDMPCSYMSSAANMPWKERGCYLISGGAGGLGRLFVQEIVQWVEAATIILVGRSPLSREQQAQLE